MQKRLAEALEGEGRLQRELDEARAERDRRVQEIHRANEKEREAARARVAEADNRAKEAEAKRALIMFEQEKERSMWTLEKDHIMQLK